MEHALGIGRFDIINIFKRRVEPAFLIIECGTFFSCLELVLYAFYAFFIEMCEGNKLHSAVYALFQKISCGHLKGGIKLCSFLFVILYIRLFLLFRGICSLFGKRIVVEDDPVLHPGDRDVVAGIIHADGAA